MKDVLSAVGRRRVFCCSGILALAGMWWISHDPGPTAEQIAAGRELFLHEWEVNDPLSNGGDGLGPVFNAKSCAACHSQGGLGGSGDNRHNVMAFEVDPDRDRTQVVSHVVHSQAISEEYQESIDTVRDLFPVIPGGVRVVGGCSVSLADHNPITFLQINSPALFGAGVIDEIPESAVIMHNARRFKEKVSDQFRGDYDHNGDGVARSHGFGRIGKFGWKGQFASVEEFVAAACAMELGLTNPQVAQPIPREHNEDGYADLDMSSQQLHQLVAFVKSLPPPEQVLPTDPEACERAIKGEALFNQIRCSDCHVKDLGEAKGIYTDFQLYSLERKFSSSVYGREEKQFKRSPSAPRLEDWKTPALWGVADSAPYFHDGQSATLEDAIRRHHGDAEHSFALYQGLNADEKKMVVEFLKTLKAPQS